MEVALAILVPICATGLTVAKWILRPKVDPLSLRSRELKLIEWMPQTEGSYGREPSGKRADAIIRYMRTYHPDRDEGRSE